MYLTSKSRTIWIFVIFLILILLSFNDINLEEHFWSWHFLTTPILKKLVFLNEAQFLLALYYVYSQHKIVGYVCRFWVIFHPYLENLITHLAIVTKTGLTVAAAPGLLSPMASRVTIIMVSLGKSPPAAFKFQVCWDVLIVIQRS